jgi:predicted metal-dependent phosphoesterase TrpH
MRAVASPDRADLHVHTTSSDGTYTPAQVVALAQRSGLAAIALTDHDTLAGISPARSAAAESRMEIIAGVEISTEYAGRELHLLGYFVDVKDRPLQHALERMAVERAARYHGMVERLHALGVRLPDDAAELPANSGTAGRRHLAEHLVRAGRAQSVRQAFTRYLADGGRVALPKLALPVREAIALVRGAGGVASWAHPPYDCQEARLAELRAWGLGAVEADFPGCRPRRSRELRALAARLGLAVTAGSDCHGADQRGRWLGARTATAQELETLRRLATR